MDTQRKIKPIKEWQHVDRAIFEKEVIPLNEPAVFRGLVSDWEAVKAGNHSFETGVRYLTSHDNQAPVYTIVGQPEIHGRFFYSDDLTGVNFQRTEAVLSSVLEQLLLLADNPKPHSVAIQAASVKQVLPTMVKHNLNPLLGHEQNPTLWFGNKAIVAPHYDAFDNIACVFMGRRHFTLFPPEQIANLYVGPALNAPGGVPISLVDLDKPDFEKHPQYSDALASAQHAELGPGDAIFIPSPWWHSVKSLDSINGLINYWWSDAQAGALTPDSSLMHSILSIAKLKPRQRESWQHFFNHLVFHNNGDPAAHLPEGLNDLITTLSYEQKKQVYELLKGQLS